MRLPQILTAAVFTATATSAQPLSEDAIMKLQIVSTSIEPIYDNLDLNTASALVTNAHVNAVLAEYCSQLGTYPDTHIGAMRGYWKARMTAFGRSLSDENFDLAQSRSPEVLDLLTKSDLYNPINSRCVGAHFEVKYWLESNGFDMEGNITEVE